MTVSRDLRRCRAHETCGGNGGEMQRALMASQLFTIRPRLSIDEHSKCASLPFRSGPAESH